jgi:sugar fermentation stimulation protein A
MMSKAHSFTVELYPAVEPATIIRRLNRFVAAVRLPDGSTTEVHVPNSGRLPELMTEGLDCLLVHKGGERKYPKGLVSVCYNGVWVLIDTQATNRIAGELLRNDKISGLEGYDNIRAEIVHKPPGHSGSVKGLSRFDYYLSEHPTKPDCWLEVKSVTLAEDSVALFPDAVTSRGAKHLRELGVLAEKGERAAVLFLVQRADPVAFSTNDKTDPYFGEQLRLAVAEGVEVFVYKLEVTETGVWLVGPLPIRL